MGYTVKKARKHLNIFRKMKQAIPNGPTLGDSTNPILCGQGDVTEDDNIREPSRSVPLRYNSVPVGRKAETDGLEGGEKS